MDAALGDGKNPLPIGGVGRLLLARASPPKAMPLAFSANPENRFPG
jgi:hypothetical protein